MPELLFFTGTSNPQLANSVAWLLGEKISACSLTRFPDGELSVTLNESVRGRSVFILQSSSPPVTENVFQLLQLVDACRRGAAGQSHSRRALFWLLPLRQTTCAKRADHREHVGNFV